MTYLNPLTFARRLASLEAELGQWQYRTADDAYHPAQAVAVSYLHVLRRLEGLGDSEEIVQIIGEAVELYEQVYDATQTAGEARREREQAEYAEAVRRHQLAVRVGCSYCDAVPGAVCRTAGPNGGGHPKAIYDHVARYRHAAFIFGRDGGDSPEELS